MKNGNKYLGSLGIVFVAVVGFIYLSNPDMFDPATKPEIKTYNATVIGETIVSAGFFSSKEVCVLELENGSKSRSTNQGCIYEVGDKVIVRDWGFHYSIMGERHD